MTDRSIIEVHDRPVRAAFAGYFPEKARVRVELRNQKGKAVISLKNILLAPNADEARNG